MLWCWIKMHVSGCFAESSRAFYVQHSAVSLTCTLDSRERERRWRPLAVGPPAQSVRTLVLQLGQKLLGQLHTTLLGRVRCCGTNGELTVKLEQAEVEAVSARDRSFLTYVRLLNPQKPTRGGPAPDGW